MMIIIAQVILMERVEKGVEKVCGAICGQEH